MEVYDGVNTMFSKFVYKFDHLFEIGFIVPIFLWLDSSPHSAKSNSIHAELFVDLIISSCEGEVGVEMICDGEVRRHFYYDTSSMNLYLSSEFVDKHQILVYSQSAKSGVA